MYDSALILRKMTDAGENISSETITEYLRESLLVKELTSTEVTTSLPMVWRLIALSEIPFAETLPYTVNLIEKIYKSLSTKMGFSLSGSKKQFLPCYNSMIISALCRLGRHKDKEVRHGIDWIMENQPFKRGNKIETIDGISFTRYGGCFNKTPCYIGVVKATNSLLSYTERCKNENIRQKAYEGLEYILSHQLFKRKSSHKPITKHIMDISFPETYHTNIVDLLRLMALASVKNDPRIDDALRYIQSKTTDQKRWRISFRYKAEGYLTFDKGREPAYWVSHIISDSLNKLLTKPQED